MPNIGTLAVVVNSECVMRVITINTNGIRAAARKGFFDWLKQQTADVVCIQETKAQLSQLDNDQYCLPGYHCFYHDAQKKGYSGVAIYSKKTPDQIIRGLGWSYADQEGRCIQADFGALSIVSLYMPSGSSGDERQIIKFDFMERYLKQLKKIKASDRQYIICGDWNIVHTAIDIKNFKSNQKNSGCLPQERAWLDALFVKQGFIDAFREVDQRPEQYTWWSNRGQAWANNVGWRIDYQILSPNLKGTVKSASIYRDQRFSDHAPLIVDYDLSS